MSERIPITEASLRAALRDPRYWTFGHPEREGYAAWVTDGYRALYNSGEAKGGTVHVRAYTRKRDGVVEHVGAHDRSAPPGGPVTPMMAGPAIRGGARAVAIIPRIIQALPRPPLPSWSSLFPDRPRPSLLDPPEEDGRRRGTLGGAVQSVPDDGEATKPSHEDGQDAGGSRPPPVIDDGRQGKHIPGHNNYDPSRGRSALGSDVDPQALLDTWAGRGTQVGSRPIGEPDSKEIFDTGDRVIGTWRDRAGEEAPTTRGAIHYGANGKAHIVPAPPRERMGR